jgi:hypothetical protein
MDFSAPTASAKASSREAENEQYKKRTEIVRRESEN